MTSAVQALVVDDDATESEAIADLLTGGSSNITAKAIRPVGDLEATAAEVLEKLPAGAPRILLLDYRLEDNDVGDSEVTYRGGTIGSYLRDRDPELPIVLLTSEQKLHDWVESRPNIKQVFDWTLLKEDVSTQDAAEIGSKKLFEFALAWDQAHNWPDDPDGLWERLAGLMGAPEGGIGYFRELEAEPPRGDVTGDVIRWLLYRALRFSGPLRDQDSTRVTLGLDRNSFSEEVVTSWLEPGAYSGALAAFHRRWWAHIIRKRLADTCGGERPLDASERAKQLSKVLKVELSPEMCDWCGGQRTINACGLCGKASDAAHCLRPLGTPLPAWADPEIVCYRCVATGRSEEAGVQFPPQAQEVVSDLEAGAISPPGDE